MASTPDTSTMTRDELEERVSELESELESVRRLAKQALEVAGNAHDRIDDVEAGEGAEDGFSERAREKMVPAHRMALDIRNGHQDRIPNKTAGRAAELFRRMMHKVDADGDPMPGVENSLGTVKISSADAAEMLVEFDDKLDTAPSAIVGRALRALQRLTKHEDCDCDDIDNCGHGIVMFHAGSTNRVQANTTRLINYLESLDEIETDEDDGDDDPDADDGDRAPEAPADDPFDRLDDAEPADPANTVVSTKERTALGAENSHVGGDNHEA